MAKKLPGFKASQNNSMSTGKFDSLLFQDAYPSLDSLVFHLKKTGAPVLMM